MRNWISRLIYVILSQSKCGTATTLLSPSFPPSSTFHAPCSDAIPINLLVQLPIQMLCHYCCRLCSFLERFIQLWFYISDYRQQWVNQNYHQPRGKHAHHCHVRVFPHRTHHLHHRLQLQHHQQHPQLRQDSLPALLAGVILHVCHESPQLPWTVPKEPGPARHGAATPVFPPQQLCVRHAGTLPKPTQDCYSIQYHQGTAVSTSQH